MKILVLGAAGMLGRALERVHAEEGRHELAERDIAACDILDEVSVRSTLAATRPAAVFLCAAWTDVDGAEADPAGALRVNGDGTRNVARACAGSGAALVYLSTDYVFDGEKPTPYLEEDPPAPINAYGRSKLAGERHVREAGDRHLVVRTSWLFGPEGKHFVDAILARAKSGAPLRVVTDQVGAPTYTIDLARALFRLTEAGARGVVNATNAGACSWHQFAERIVARAGLAVPVERITSQELARPARRPRNSRLDGRRLRALGVAMPSWEDALERYLRERDAGPGGGR